MSSDDDKAEIVTSVLNVLILILAFYTLDRLDTNDKTLKEELILTKERLLQVEKELSDLKLNNKPKAEAAP